MDELTKAESQVPSPKSQVATAAASAAGDSANDAVVTVADAEDLVGEDAKLGKAAARVSTRSAGETTHTARSEISTEVAIPKAPFYGSKVVEITDLTKIFAFINETALFKGQWQYKQGRTSTEDYKKILDETVYPKFAEVKAKAIREKLLESEPGLWLFSMPLVW